MRLAFAGIRIDLVLLLIGIAPVFYWVDRLNPNVAGQKFVFVQCVAVLMLAVCHSSKWVGAFLFLALTHFLIFEPHYQMAQSLHLLSMYALIYMLITHFYEGQGYKWVILLVALATLCLIPFQIFKADIFTMQNLEPTGFFNLPSYMGIFGAITAPLLAYIHPALLLLSVCLVALSKSTLAALALAVAVVFYFWHTNRRLSQVLAVIGVLAASFFINSVDRPSGEWDRRVHIWKMVASRAFRSPFVGHGIGSYSKIAFIEFRGKSNYYFNVRIIPENEEPLKKQILAIAKLEGVDTERLTTIHYEMEGGIFKNLNAAMDELRGRGLHGYVWDRPHNTYLLIFYEFGLAGLLLLAGFLWSVFEDYRWGNRETKALGAMILAVAIVATVHFPLDLPSITPVIVALSAIYASKQREW